ncbi:MAG: T9SS type A sorting domain-containing protein [Bacteroidetes bacterium]|nr:T9SS type A sorting domain-containing protein [Bacteroidota bacterium]
MTNGQITYYTTKFSAAGTVLWTQSYNGGPLFYLDPKIYLAIDGSGNAYVTVPIGGIASNIATIKYSSSGIQSWIVIFNGPANQQDFATGLLTYQSSSPLGGVTYPSVYVCGMSDFQSDAIPGYVTLIKYTQSSTVGGKVLAKNSADEQFHTAGQFEAASLFSLSNYPNPYKGTTYITYSLPYDSHVLIQVFDAAGRAVAVPINEHQLAGRHTEPFESGRLTPGMYSYRILATSTQGTLKDTRQMIVQ